MNIAWPAEGVARAPYAVFSDPEVYALEQEKIFRGPTWHFLAMELELPEAGSFVLASVGDTPVVVARDEEGEIHAMVNRCAHKGTPLVFTPSGKLERLRFMCIYHNWMYDLQGRLKSVAFEKGVAGKGGMPPDFRKEEHALEKLRVHRIAGLVFGTFSAEAPPFEEYIGADHVSNIQRVCGRPMTLLGKYSQLLHSNWKLYMENVKDPYHASLLHAFNGVMRQDRLTMEGGIRMGARGWHHISYSKMGADTGGEVYSTAQLRSAELEVYGEGLRDSSLTDVWDDYGDRVTLTVQTVFPCFVLQQLRTCLAVRSVVPKGPGQTELRWTAFGYESDDERKRALRLKQANMMGPAGLISMEDGMIGALIQRSIEGDRDKASVMELGGRGIEPIAGSRASEGSVRGFWTGYRFLTGL
jgi:anthranilate 1,2-dioxygenase large subunit/terephthalate 1,2-dioxygenase oxygenase component alpha subunit